MLPWMAKQAKFAHDLERAKAESVGQLLLKAARLWNEEAVRRVQAQVPSFRMAHTLLLPHIDLEGTRLTDLAARVGTTKQAVGEIVASLEEQGLLERVADPTDKRAKLVRFTAAGRQNLLVGVGLLREMEAELAGDLGTRRMEALGGTLRRLVEILERR